jgi:hypothetical protein
MSQKQKSNTEANIETPNGGRNLVYSGHITHIPSPTSRSSKDLSSDAESNEQVDLIPIRLPLSARFYEPIALLESLNNTCRNAATRYHKIESINFTESRQDAFHCLLNKLAQVCDIKRGGTTVTSCVVEMLPSVCRFVFASNKRTDTEVCSAKAFVELLLTTIKSSASSAGKFWSDDMAKQVFDFNKARISMYINHLDFFSEECLKRSELGGSSTCELSCHNRIRRTDIYVSTGRKDNLDERKITRGKVFNKDSKL